MGGTKKKTLASMEKSQSDDSEPQQDGTKKKTTEKSKPIGERKRVEVLMPKLGDQELLKVLSTQKAITIYSAARGLSVSASVANAILTSLEAKGHVKRVGGFSGHYVWMPASISRT